MIDKHRHRHHPVPHGGPPNWVLVAFAAASILIVRLAQTVL